MTVCTDTGIAVLRRALAFWVAGLVLSAAVSHAQDSLPPMLPAADTDTVVHSVAPPQDDSAPADDVASQAAPQAVVLEEEDIFSELSRQGLRIDGTEAGLQEVVPDQIESLPVLSDAQQDSAAAHAAAMDSSREGPDMPLDGDEMMPDRYRDRYGRYGAPEMMPQDPEAPVAAADTITAPARVDDVRSVNFARNLAQYRSPRRSILLSMLLPGLGQAYSRTYWKTALFGVVELGLLGASIGYNAASNNKTQEAFRYADVHYDTSGTRFLEYYGWLKGYFEGLAAVDTSRDAQSDIDLIFYPRFTRNSSGGYDTLRTPQWYPQERDKKSKTYYDWISSAPYTQGWDDVEPGWQTLAVANPGDTIAGVYATYVVHPSRDYFTQADSLFLVTIAGDRKSQALYGYSSKQQTYNSKRADANSYKRVSTNLLVVLLLNHITSAVDAGITAKRYNDRMLGRLSRLDRIHLEQHMVYTGSEYVPGLALRVDF